MAGSADGIGRGTVSHDRTRGGVGFIDYGEQQLRKRG